MQTILGSGGSVGSLLAKELTKYTSKIRIVSRNPQRVNDTDEILSADLSNKAETSNAIKGSQIVYLLVGVEYKYKIWEEKWPVIINNVIDGCIEHNSRLVFLDNIYMLGKNELNNITENSEINPCSKKGEVRAELNRIIFKSIEEKGLKAIIARAGDFYGPHPNESSLLMKMVFNKIRKGEKAQWFINADKKHAFTYTPDIAKALAKLGNTETAYNQVWNMPTDKNALTGKEWVNLISEKFGKPPKYQVLPNAMFSILSLFVPIIKELKEMNYQFEEDYIIDSSKIEKELQIIPTTYQEGINNLIK